MYESKIQARDTERKAVTDWTNKPSSPALNDLGKTSGSIYIISDAKNPDAILTKRRVFGVTVKREVQRQAPTLNYFRVTI